MRHRQIVVLQIDVIDSEGMNTYGDPAGWPWAEILNDHAPGANVQVEIATVRPETLDAGYAADPDEWDYQPGHWRFKPHEAVEVPFYVNVYEVGQSYGGPEEGGWWFSTGDPVEEACERYETELGATIAQKRLREEYPRTDRQFSVLGGADYEVRIEDHPPTAWPAVRPHYC